MKSNTYELLKDSSLHDIDEKHLKWLRIRGSYVSGKHKIVYIKTPKVACTTMAVSMYYAEGIDVPSPLSDVHLRFNDAANHVSSLQSSGRTLSEVLQGEDWFRFSFVRNPYDRMVSAYKSKILGPSVFFNELKDRIKMESSWYTDSEQTVSFYDFVRFVCNQPDSNRDPHWKTQCSILRPLHIKYHFIGRFENFSEDYLHVFSRVPGVNWSKVGATKRVTSFKSPLALVYSKDLADLVYQTYEDDFYHFNYARSSWMSG